MPTLLLNSYLFCNTLYDFYNNIISNKLYLCRQKLK